MRWLLCALLLLTSCAAPMATGIGQGIAVQYSGVPLYSLAPVPQPVRAVSCIRIDWWVQCQ